MSEQDEALRLADQLGTCSLQVGEVEQIHAAFHLRRQHAEIERLTAERDQFKEWHAKAGAAASQTLRDLDAIEAERDALREALRSAIDLAWVDDSHVVEFDGTVVFGIGYDFSGLEGCRRSEFLGQESCIVWPKSNGKWSAYCTYEGSMWFERFDTEEQAKEACMQLLDKIMPMHPAMKARAALAQIKEQP